MKSIWLAALLLGLAASPANADESLTADQLYARRAELDKKVVRALFEWHHNFEASDAHVWMPDGTVRNLAVEFDVDRLKRLAPIEWKKIADAQRRYWEEVKVAAAKKKTRPEDIHLLIDADVEVALPPPQKDKNVIVIGPDLLLKVVALHSVRKEETNQAPEPMPLKRHGSS
jgi:hypothetical protein